MSTETVPAIDWAATSLFLLARVQLDQMVAILEGEFGIRAHTLSGTEVTRRLEECFQELGPLPDDEDVEYEFALVGEAVDLWRALETPGARPVSHAFAVDGSISFTSGPDLPELSALGVTASSIGELEIAPNEVLGAGECLHARGGTAGVLRRNLKRQREAKNDVATSAPEEEGSTAEPRMLQMSRAGQRSLLRLVAGVGRRVCRVGRRVPAQSGTHYRRGCPLRGKSGGSPDEPVGTPPRVQRLRRPRCRR